MRGEIIKTVTIYIYIVPWMYIARISSFFSIPWQSKIAMDYIYTYNMYYRDPYNILSVHLAKSTWRHCWRWGGTRNLKSHRHWWLLWTTNAPFPRKQWLYNIEVGCAFRYKRERNRKRYVSISSKKVNGPKWETFLRNCRELPKGVYADARALPGNEFFLSILQLLSKCTQRETKQNVRGYIHVSHVIGQLKTPNQYIYIEFSLEFSFYV